MGEAALNDVFLSYASEDEVVALRVYSDLTRARLAVWRFQSEGRIGAFFPDDIQKAIPSSRFLCLLDSPAARRSEWVRKECELAQQFFRRAGRPERVPCRIGNLSRELDLGPELFENQNLTAYIDFADYDDGIMRLCEHLRVPYTPKFQLPRDRDFENEAHESPAKLNPRQITQLLEGYGNFRAWYASDPAAAEHQICTLIKLCDDLGALLISPRLALGVLQAESGRHEAAAATFKRLTMTHRDDPRPWAGLGGAQYYVGSYAAALNSYRCSLALTEKGSDQSKTLHVTEIVHNFARTLVSLERFDEAWAHTEVLTEAAKAQPFVKALRGHIRLRQGRTEEALQLLEAAFLAFNESHALPTAVVIDLADCYRAHQCSRDEERVLRSAISLLQNDPEIWRRWADYCLESGEHSRALHALHQAVKLTPDAVVYRAELALLLRQLGHGSKARENAHACLNLRAVSAREHYYLGLAFYLTDHVELAQREREQSRSDAVVGRWPEYRAAVTPQQSFADL